MIRTHTCGELTIADDTKQVTMSGWVHRIRDHGGVFFIDLRDRYGLTQVVFNPDINAQSHLDAQEIKPEYVIEVTGVVEPRPEGTRNLKLPTGQIEVRAEKLNVLSESKTPPFPIADDDQPVGEDIRLKYRYLDLRRSKLQEGLLARHRVVLAVRNYLSGNGFVEIETPMLGKSTPEGARDYLVPSRVNPGTFYALPQSPQLMKQLLMVSGFDRYFQICRCFRDEDLRADRQPEFTQIDLEMSFATEDDIYSITEGILYHCFKAGIDKEIELPFKRLPHPEAIELYGIDKPDLRFDMHLCNLTELAQQSEMKIFKEVVGRGGIIKGIAVPGGCKYSRKDIDDLTKFASIYGAKGMAYIKVTSDGLTSPIAKFFNEDLLKQIVERAGATTDDIVFMVADTPKIVNDSLAALRNKIGKDLGLYDEKDFNFLWVTDFPLFSYNEEEDRFESEHHPFTSPKTEDIPLLDADPLKVRSSSYDLVLNGVETASGSVRIHQSDIQEKIFKLLKMTDDEIRAKFGFFIDALKFGAPPHAGIAPGLDRILMIMLGLDSIRDVIAFPKTQKATDLMAAAPSEVAARQLKELHISLNT
jgi:aspartyl-tRNA synthetase